jgi:tetratricopeptide (TPR) repeat protein
LRRELRLLHSPRDRAATILSFLHREVLIGNFDANCGHVALAFDEGRYNCVTATILFAALAKQLDLPVVAVHTPGHVRLRMSGPEGLEIETTSATWFANPQESGLRTLNHARALNEVALVGKLFYNRGVQALEARDFDVASTHFERALALDPLDVAARQNLLAALNNSALELCAAAQYSPARQRMESALRIDPLHKPSLANVLHVEQRWTVWLCEQGRFAEADRLLSAGALRQPDEALYREGRVAVLRLWADELARRGETHAALAKLAQARAISP